MTTALARSSTGLDKPLGLGIMLSVHDMGTAALQRFGATFTGFAMRVRDQARHITTSLLDIGKGFLMFKAGSMVFSAGLSLANRAGEFGQKLTATPWRVERPSPAPATAEKV